MGLFRVKWAGKRNWINVAKIFFQSVPLAKTAGTTFLDIANADLLVQGLLDSCNQHYPFSPAFPFYPCKPKYLRYNF